MEQSDKNGGSDITEEDLEDAKEQIEEGDEKRTPRPTSEPFPGPTSHAEENLEDPSEDPDQDTIERLTPAEFRDEGYLQEINRRLLHPLGLALEVFVDDRDEIEAAFESDGFQDVEDLDPQDVLISLLDFALEGDMIGNKTHRALIGWLNTIPRRERFGGVWDDREDPTGIVFHPDEIDNSFLERANKVDDEIHDRKRERYDQHGFYVQPPEPGYSWDQWEERQGEDGS